jgi:hypothetical protein
MSKFKVVAVMPSSLAPPATCGSVADHEAVMIAVMLLAPTTVFSLPHSESGVNLVTVILELWVLEVSMVISLMICSGLVLGKNRYLPTKTAFGLREQFRTSVGRRIQSTAGRRMTKCDYCRRGAIAG